MNNEELLGKIFEIRGKLLDIVMELKKRIKDSEKEN